jgi:molybdopterin molybdotransferase
LLNPDAALELILSSVAKLETQRVALRECLGRVLAEDVSAVDDIPPFDNTAMDGYAVIAEDTRGASRETPVRLRVIADQPAGRADAGPVTRGTAVRIMTGAPIPDGADCVVIVEDTECVGGEVVVYREAPAAANIRRAGEDVKSGQVVVKQGTVVRPAEMGMLASVGVVEPAVYRKPRVALITTGDELVDASQKPGRGQIRNSNQYSLLGEALQAGCVVPILQRTRDDKDEIERVLRSASVSVDLVVVCGGVSVGDYDYVKGVLEQLGEMKFWKVAIKPGMPLAFGRIAGKPVFGLPGNPVSCMVCFEVFIRPALRKMAGEESNRREVVMGVLTDDVRHKPGRREFVRAVSVWEDDGYLARPIPKHGSGMLSSMVEANSYVVVGEDTGDVRRGEQVEIILFRP